MAASKDKNGSEFDASPVFRATVEQTIEQSRLAHNQMLDATRRAQDMATRSGDVMTSSAREINERIMRYTAQNLEANFSLARELTRATDFKDVLEMQQAFAQRQMATYALQAQELTRLMTEAAQRAQPKS